METILITTDFSKTASNAVKYAAQLSKALDIKSVILYHSYDDENIDATLLHEGSLLALEILSETIKMYLDKKTKIELIANDLPLLMGVERICAQHKVDLVVAGSTGKGGLAKFLIGSNTINLADKCPAPLLVVPDEAEFEPIKKIVFACAMEKVKQTTPVDTISLFTRQLNSKLLVLNVALEHKRFNPDIIPEQYEIHRLLDDLNPSYHYIEEDEVVEGIMDFVEDKGAQLLISVPKSYGFFDSLFRRSVTKKLAYDTETPLLVLRERENQHEK